MHAIKARDTHQSVAATKKRKSKGKQHPVHASSLLHIADDMETLSKDPAIKHLDNSGLAAAFCNIINKEFLRVRGILR